MAGMKLAPGDLIQRVKINSTGKRIGSPKILGLLLEEPKYPQWGNYPKSYTVLTQGGIQLLRDQALTLIEAVEES